MEHHSPEVSYKGQYESDEFDAGNSGSGTKTIDWNEGNCQKVTMDGNCTFAFSNPRAGARYMLRIVQDATGSRVATWPDEVHWPATGAPLLSSGNRIDLIAFYCSDNVLYASYASNYVG